MTEEEVKLFFDKVRRCQNLYNSIVYERDHIEEDLADVVMRVHLSLFFVNGRRKD